MEERLRSAFASAGHRQPRVYQTCGGFALVTSVERARLDGSPFGEPERFVDLDEPMSAIEELSLYGVLSALFRARPGRFRLIVIVVSDHGLAPLGSLSPQEAREWTQDGLLGLPTWIGKRPFTPGHDVSALVYEFEKASGSEHARLVTHARRA